MPTQKQIDDLADAMWQLLDDMGKSGQSVCLAAKADARLAFEPFRDAADGVYEDWMSVEDAARVREEANR